MSIDDLEQLAVDVLVVGGGMAGMTAAARAVHRGARVAVVEVAESLGGSAQVAGYAWTAPTTAVMDRVNPRGDRALTHALVDRFADAVAWIRSLGVICHEPVSIIEFGVGHQFDTLHYIDRCRRSVEAAGSSVLL